VIAMCRSQAALRSTLTELYTVECPARGLERDAGVIHAIRVRRPLRERASGRASPVGFIALEKFLPGCFAKLLIETSAGGPRPGERTQRRRSLGNPVTMCTHMQSLC
jgi:hypothetical protein